jgi:glycosyltransferase involved in cell wall biosynthesis
MKILLLTTWYPNKINPNHGIFIQDQAVVLSREHEVLVVAARIDYTKFGFSKVTKATTAHQKVEEIRMVVNKSLPVFNQLNFFIRAFWETYKIARQFRPDVIHGNIGYPGAFWAWLISKAIGKPYVITEHTRITNNFRSFIHKKLTLFSLMRASGIISVSHNHARELNKYTGRKIIVIPNVIKFSKYENVTVLSPSKPVQIGFLGGMNTPIKGLDILLQALAKVKHDFILHVGGKGTLLEEYKDMARKLALNDKCIFYGFVPPNEVPQFMGKIHFLVSASRFETFGISMVEALASGLPVLATDSGGPQDFIDSTNGIIVKRENVSALEEGLNQMMLEYTKYDSLKIRKEITFKFSTENFLKQINSVYEGATSIN